MVAVFEYIAATEKVSALTLDPIDSENAIFSDLDNALIEAGWRGIHRYFCFGNWIHKLTEESYEDYLSNRPSRVKNTLRRRSKNFSADNKGAFDIVASGTSLDKTIDQFNQVYHSSWKQNEPYPEFMPSLVRLAEHHGWLRLGLAYYEGKPVAAQIWLVKDGTAFIFKLAYDEAYKHLSVGTLLTAHMLRHVIDEDRVQRLDYLSGDDTYKQDWMSLRRERHGIAAYNPRTLSGITEWAKHQTKSFLKSKVRLKS